jgi:hypothetical protein
MSPPDLELKSCSLVKELKPLTKRRSLQKVGFQKLTDTQSRANQMKLPLSIVLFLCVITLSSSQMVAVEPPVQQEGALPPSAVDLAAAYEAAEGQGGDQVSSLEALLHWAIGKWGLALERGGQQCARQRTDGNWQDSFGHQTATWACLQSCIAFAFHMQRIVTLRS